MPQEALKNPRLKLGMVAAACLLAAGVCTHCGKRDRPRTVVKSDGNEVGQSQRTENDASSRVGLTLTAEGIGPIDAATPATIEELRKRLPGYEVKEQTSGLDLGAPNLHVLADGRTVLIVLPTERHELYTVRVVSPDVSAANGWRTGTTLDDTEALTQCSCLADGLHCTGKDARVGVILNDDCLRKMMDSRRKQMYGEPETSQDEWYRKLKTGDRTALAQLAGRRIRMLLWQPQTTVNSQSAGAGIPNAPIEERLAKCREKPTTQQQIRCQAMEKAREAGLRSEP